MNTLYLVEVDLTRDRAVAAILGAVDYKATFACSYATDADYDQALSECHTRSARRVLRALLANGGWDCISVTRLKTRFSLDFDGCRCFHKDGTTYSFFVCSSGRMDQHHATITGPMRANSIRIC